MAVYMYHTHRPLPAKMSKLSFCAKTGFDIYAMIRTSRVTRENFQAPIISAYIVMTMWSFGQHPFGS